jgi:DNA repair ATPase RecN
VRFQKPITVISGDSGVGKTRLLEEIVGCFDGAAPAPVMVGHAPAALQAALLEALGSAAAIIVHDEGAARRVGQLLVEGGRRLARVKANEIGLAVARVALGAVRDRVGENVD